MSNPRPDQLAAHVRDEQEYLRDLLAREIGQLRDALGGLKDDVARGLVPSGYHIVERAARLVARLATLDACERALAVGHLSKQVDRTAP